MKNSALKILLIEDNAILAHASQNSANEAGVYCIRHCDSTEQALETNAKSPIQFNVALLKYAGDIQTDLQHMNALHRQGKTRAIVLVGSYSPHEKQALKKAARTQELPLLGLLDLPLSSGHLRNLLQTAAV
ncbi:response regulator [Pseudomonas sp. C2B4]|uniref:response regulator n=1 Tax=Pseudomonas sp. C2B4 TaxID=2735270 RepID=UPI001585D826|nr:response regulator [Pseudomonas sp. C2B4]NUU36798.1 response regulator [Pseudomonas sp. C2B4]